MIKSFSDCLKTHGLDKFERDLLTTRREALVAGKEAADGHQAALMAVNAYESELMDQRDAILKGLGMEIPAREKPPAPETPGPTTAGPAVEPKEPETPKPEPKGPSTAGPAAEPKAPKITVTVAQAKKHWSEVVLPNLDEDMTKQFQDADWRMLDGAPHVIAKDGSAFHFIREEGRILEVEDFVSPAARRRAVGKGVSGPDPMLDMIEKGDAEGIAKALYEETGVTPGPEQFPQLLPDNLIRMLVDTAHQEVVEANMKKAGFKITDRAQLIAPGGEIRDNAVTISALYRPEKGTFTDTGWMPGQLKGQKKLTNPNPTDPVDVQVEDILAQLQKSDLLDPQMGSGTYGSFMAREAVFYYVKTATEFLGDKFSNWSTRNAPKKAIAAAIRDGNIAEVQAAATHYLETLNLLSATVRDTENVDAVATALRNAYYDDKRQRNSIGNDLQELLDVDLDAILSEVVSLYKENENTSDQTNRKVKVDPKVPPRLEGIVRRGLTDWRQGRNIETADEFKTEFGFTDVEFGNWVNQIERQENLNLAFDALHDLAHILGIDPKKIGGLPRFGKDLGLAFGGRGKGKASAHYETGNHVINLTKNKGNGTVSHEWTHALEWTLRDDPSAKALTEGLRRALQTRLKISSIESQFRSILKSESTNPSDRNVPPRDAALEAMLNTRSLENRISWPTEFLENAKKMDEGGEAYWAKKAELVARASEAYYHDIVKGGSPYLTSPYVRDGVATEKNGFSGTPYPLGKERSEYTNKVIEVFLSQIDWATLEAKDYRQEATLREGKDGQFYLFDQHWHQLGVYDKKEKAEAAQKGYQNAPTHAVLTPDRYFAGLANEEAWRVAENVDAIMKEMGIAPHPEVKDGSMAESMFFHLRFGWWPTNNADLDAFAKKAYRVDDIDLVKRKRAQEDFEAALARYAGQRAVDMAMQGTNPEGIYDYLVGLYEKQPNLNVRDSTSLMNQGYSTPAPIAWIVSLLARANNETTAYDPTAGNGLLVLGFNPKKVILNELEARRLQNLRAMEYGKIIEGDATTVMERGAIRKEEVDVAVMNPPFGAMAKEVEVEGYRMRAIDQLIVATNLDAMKEDGRAVLIMGANKEAGMISAKDRPFLNWLYSHYNVADHFEVDGKLYERMGASWPIRVIVIAGRQLSDKLGPETGTIGRVTSHDELWERYVQAHARSEQVLVGTVGVPNPTGSAAGQPGSVPGSNTGQGQPPAGGAQPGGTGPNTGGLPGPGNRPGQPGQPGGSPGINTGPSTGPGNGQGGIPGRGGRSGATPGGDQGSGRTGPRGVPGGTPGLGGVDPNDIDNILGDHAGESTGKGAKGGPSLPRTAKKNKGTEGLGVTLGDGAIGTKPGPGPIPKTSAVPYVAPEAERDVWSDTVAELVKARPFFEFMRIDPANGRWNIDSDRTLHFSFVSTAPLASTPKFLPAGRAAEYLVLNGVAYNSAGIYNPITGFVYQVGAFGLTGPIAKIPGTDIPQTAGDVLDDLFGTKMSQGDKVDIDGTVYAKAKPAFQQMWDSLWERIGEAMAVIKAFRDAAIARWNDKILPYLRAFVMEKVAEQKERDLASRKRPIVRPAADNELQVVYQGRSQGDSTGVMIPRDHAESLALAFANAEDEIAERAPDGIDQYVMQELGYESLEDMWHGKGLDKTAGKGLGGYQVDAVGLTLLQFERGGGMIIGDATGVGKGRTAAAMINWAVRKGKIPVFVTVDATLYSSMIKDMEDIGTPHDYVMTNSGVPVINEDEELVRRGQSDEATRDALEHIIVNGTLPGEAKVLFTTYAQLRSNSKGSPNRRPDALRALTQSGKAVYIMDEAHNASGASAPLFMQFLTGENIDTAKFPQAPGWEKPPVAYFSATFAKRPDNLPIYARTHISLLGQGVDDLTALFSGGGVPLQQVVSRMLVESGQLMRRERDLSHVHMNWKIDTANGPRDRRLFDQVTDVLRSVVHADSAVKDYMGDSKWVVGFIEDLIAAGLLPPGSTNGLKVGEIASGTTRVDFMSVVHNYLAQLLLATKIDNTVQETIDAHNRGEKVVIALQNTMEAMLDDYVSRNRIKVGDPIPDFGWKSVSRRGLDNTLRIKFEDRGGHVHQVAVPLHMWPGPVQDEYKRTEQKIEQLRTTLPASPIDKIIGQLRAHVIYDDKGKPVAAMPANVPPGKVTRPFVIQEITGRSTGADYSTSPPTYYSREKPKKKNIVNGFNNGPIDALIINASGSTGLNLHASADYADQRPRHMIIAQPALDIAIFQQTIGRTNRTWQVEDPIYTVMGTEVPAETRPMAMLRKKLKILTSNTSSSNRTAGEVDVTDFINEYGSIIVAQYLREHPQVREFVGIDIPVDDDAVPDDLAHKVSGRIALMSTSDQENFYQEVMQNYDDDIKRRNEDGTNRLDLHHYPFNAELVEQAELAPGMDPSGRYPLAGPSYVGRYEVDILGAPPTANQVKREVAASLGGRDNRAVVAQIEADLKIAYDNALDRLDRKIRDLQKGIADPNVGFKEQEALTRMLGTAEDELRRFRDIKDETLSSLRATPIGSAYMIEHAERQSWGVIVGFQIHKSSGGNPYSPSNFKFNVLRALPQGRTSLALTRWRAMEVAGNINSQDNNPNVDDLFQDRGLTGGRDSRHIITGNIPTAFRDLNGSGEIMTFNLRGGTKAVDGLLMPPSFRPGALAKQPYAFVTATQATNYLLAAGHHVSQQSGGYNNSYWAKERGDVPAPADFPSYNMNSQISVYVRGKFLLAVPQTNGVQLVLSTDLTGKRWAKDKGLVAITGPFQAMRGRPYRAMIPPSKVRELMEFLRKRVTLHVSADMRDYARTFDSGPVRFSETTASAQSLSSADQVRSWIAPLGRSWKGPKIEVVQSVVDLPHYDEMLRRGQIKVGQRFAGIYMQNKVYLIADHIENAKDAQFTAAHEVLGHYGLAGVLGDRIEEVMLQIYRDNPWVRQQADKKTAGFGYSQALATEEVLSDMAGHYDQIRSLNGFQMLIAAIRQGLRRLGFSVLMSDNDLLALLQNARRYVTGPGKEIDRVLASKEPLFSMLDDGPIGAIKQELLDRFAFDGKSMSWINKTINTQLHKAAINPYFRPVYKGVQRYIADVNSMANDAADLAGEHVLPRMRDMADVWFNPFKFSNWKKERQLQKDLRAVGQVIWTATLGYVRPSANQLANGFAATVKDSHGDTIGVVNAPALSQEQIGIYENIRRTIDLSLDQATASEMVKLAKDPALERRLPSLEDARRAAKDDPQQAEQILTGALQEWLDIVADMRGTQTISGQEANKLERTIKGMMTGIEGKGKLARKLQDEGYAPLMRFGQYTVKVMVPEELPGGGTRENVLYFGMFESMKDANQMGREMLADLQQDHPEAILVNGTMDTEAWKQLRGLSLDTLEAFASITGMDEDKAVQEYLKMAIASRSALKRLIHRKGIQGYDEDIQRVLATFVTSQARYAARNYHFGEITEATQAIPQEMGDVRTEASLLSGYVQNPTEEAQGIRGFLFTQFLGGSIASAMTNITQPILMTLPYLSQYAGGQGASGFVTAPAAASKALAKALQVVAKGITNDADLQEAWDIAAAEGVTEPQEIHQLYAESIRSGLGGRSLLSRKALRLWGSMFSLSESFNRKITFVAAFELARAPGALAGINAKRAAVGHEQFKSAYEFAVNAVDETQGVYNKGNRPNWARGAVGATVFTFKQFSIAYVEFLSRLPAREKAIALAILVVAAGAEGLPFEDDLVDLWDTIWQAMGFSSNAKKSIRGWAIKTLGEAGGGFLIGGISGLPGSPVDISGRLGVGNLIPGTGIFARSTQDATREVAQAMGPLGSVLMSARQAFAAAEEGQFKSAVHNVVPKAIRDAMQAADMFQTGHYRDLKGRRTIDTDGVDAMFKAIGLMPHNVARDARIRSDIQQDIALHNVVEASIADRWAKGITENDQDEVQAAIKQLFAWNLRNPNAPIAISPQQIRQRVLAANMTAEARLRKQTPRELRAREFQ